jgi:hypothetical protein
MSTKLINIALLGSVCLLIGAAARKELTRVSHSEIGKNIVLVGDLGRPIGEEVTIQGYKIGGNIYGDCFHVDSLNGVPFNGPFWIRVKGVREWPDKTKATLRGHEVGTVEFTHSEDGNLAPSVPGPEPHQVVYLRFEVLDILKPKNLKLGER